MRTRNVSVGSAAADELCVAANATTAVKMLSDLFMALVCSAFVHRRWVETPNDLKLSDRGARRGGCMVAVRWRPEAAAVTCGAVRCSAWLGASFIGK